MRSCVSSLICTLTLVEHPRRTYSWRNIAVYSDVHRINPTDNFGIGFESVEVTHDLLQSLNYPRYISSRLNSKLNLLRTRSTWHWSGSKLFAIFRLLFTHGWRKNFSVPWTLGHFHRDCAARPNAKRIGRKTQREMQRATRRREFAEIRGVIDREAHGACFREFKRQPGVKIARTGATDEATLSCGIRSVCTFSDAAAIDAAPRPVCLRVCNDLSPVRAAGVRGTALVPHSISEAVE